jgi:hypothetical protein
MVIPGMVDGQNGVLGHAVSHAVVGKAYRHARAQIQFPMYMAKVVSEKTG